MARLYADENFPRAVVTGLRALGHDVLTIQEHGYGNKGTSDVLVLELAKTQRRAVLTLNRADFIRLHRRSSDHAGIVVCTSDLDYAAQAERINAAVTACETLDSTLLRVNRLGT